MPDGLTERQQREKAYYDQFAAEYADLTVSFDAIESGTRRPWNSYWQLFHKVQDEFRPGARLLDFGCGWGTNTVVFARMGYHVTGFDISQTNIDTARSLAEKYGVSDQVDLSIQTAEKLTYPDNSFDVIAGCDILHHVDIAASMRECARVLKPGGMAVFREPTYSPLFDRMRNSRALKAMVPNTASFERHITEDERKLSREDMATIEATFPRTELMYFDVITRLATFRPAWRSQLERIDYRLRWIPGMKQESGSVLIVAHKS